MEDSSGLTAQLESEPPIGVEGRQGLNALLLTGQGLGIGREIKNINAKDS